MVREGLDPWECVRCSLGSPEDMLSVSALQRPILSMVSVTVVLLIEGMDSSTRPSTRTLGEVETKEIWREEREEERR